MPAKSVRFLGTATMSTYTPEAAYASISSDSTPSSAMLSPSSYSSSSTASSSSGPITPPSAYPTHLPHQYHSYIPHSYRYKPFHMPQPQPPSPPRMHRLLDSSRRLRYDLTLSPTNAAMHDRYPLSAQVLSEFATYPPLQYLEITCRYMPWVIPVTSSHYVTIQEVLYAIYMNLRKNLSEPEFRSNSLPGMHHHVTNAYRRRYSNIPHSGAYEAEKRSGLKKVDLLMENKWFAGLRSTSDPNRWVLEVSAYS